MYEFGQSLTLLALAAAVWALFRARRIDMSAEFDKLKVDIAEAKAELVSKNARIQDLEAQLAAAQASAGVPLADVAAADADLASALDTATPVAT